MADKLDPTEEKLSLSMPSLRRKRRKRAADRSEEHATEIRDEATGTHRVELPVPEAPAEPPAGDAPAEPPAGDAPAEPAPVVDPPQDSGAEDTAVLSEVPAAQPTHDDRTAQSQQPEQPVEDADDTTDAVGSSAGLASGPIPGAPSPPVAAARPHPEDPAATAAESPTVGTTDSTEGIDDAEGAETPPWHQRVDLIPMLPGRIAALVTGAVVGLAGTALTYAGLQGCSSVRGTSTCGAPGFILLFAILVILVLLGSVLFTVWQIDGAGSASVLGVGLTTVLVILFLTGVIFSPWMFLVVPVVGAVSFFGSWWVTTHFVDEPVDPWP